MGDKMDRKTLIKRKIMNKFIDATFMIIDTEGVGNVTIRKVSSIAGYSSSTLYNYFEDLDHLVLFACIRYLRDYTQGLKNYIKNAKNSFERYILIWKCFCAYSFERPEIYNLIFFSGHSNSLNNTISEYYRIFPEELADSSLRLNSMLIGNDIYSRTLYSFEGCVEEGYFNEEDIVELNEITILIYQSVLSNLLKKNPPYSSEEALKKVMKYIRRVVKAYQLPNN
ncbi:TetR/AcrR family transcriptional regulator [Clostridium sp. HV4-5-A1G]|jgi:AcrR family transcriptional regulator|nr:TetR/AcrR family transcriptional regulator [Clostridium sp. HV4-5-A1G]KAA8664152.1 TetR/AcrR family transcriptional regulator [Clostridium sp. HV4-5-A1G]